MTVHRRQHHALEEENWIVEWGVLQVIDELEDSRDKLQQAPDLVAGQLRELENLRQRQRSTGEAISSSRACPRSSCGLFPPSMRS